MMAGLLEDTVDPYAGSYSLMDGPFEIAARRQRNAVISHYGRQEGPFTGVLNKAVPAVGNALLNMVTFPGRYARGETGYVPGQMAAEQPKATDWAADTAMNMVGAPALTGGVPGMGSGIRAYHGSPHDFDRFDISKVGMGEGAQAYGHGLYFAENEAVARGYRDALSSPVARLDPAKVVDELADVGGFSPEAVRMAREELGNFKGDAGQTLSILDGLYANTGYRRAKEAAQVIRAMKPEVYRGRMYEVNINARPEQFLDWDKPLSQQDSVIQRVFSEIPQVPEIPGQLAYYRMAGKKLQSPETSEALREAGIPGIKYLDQGSRGLNQSGIALLERDLEAARKAGNADKVAMLERDLSRLKPTSNYVVFDDKLIDILKKYGILAPFAAPAAQGLMQEPTY